MALSPTDRVLAAPNVVFRALGDEAVVLHLDGGLYFGLDEIGTAIWRLLDQHDLAGVADALTREFDVDPEVASTDVVAFVTELQGRGLVRRAGDA